ncbi:hypothetical protein Scep_030348 [Stephania cephalantha]|uniref:Uncharacterized protein n=1 Tax=Stephania cephalantha TaxID=152367 RepID=A0AAP0HGE6_9MAGN
MGCAPRHGLHGLLEYARGCTGFPPQDSCMTFSWFAWIAWVCTGTHWLSSSRYMRDVCIVCMGGVDAITTDDPEIIFEILLKQDDIFASRPKTVATIHLASGASPE